MDQDVESAEMVTRVLISQKMTELIERAVDDGLAHIRRLETFHQIQNPPIATPRIVRFVVWTRDGGLRWRGQTYWEGVRMVPTGILGAFLVPYGGDAYDAVPAKYKAVPKGHVTLDMLRAAYDELLKYEAVLSTAAKLSN